MPGAPSSTARLATGTAAPCPAPGAKELIHQSPSVERDTEGVGLQDTIQIRECAKYAARIIVIGDGPTEAILITDAVGWIGDDKVDVRVWQLSQYARAITLQDFVDREHGGISVGIGGLPMRAPDHAARSSQSKRDGIVE